MILFEKCFEYARSLATVNYTRDKYSEFESFIASRVQDIDEETQQGLSGKRIRFQRVEVEIYDRLIELSAYKATKSNVFLGVNILICLGYTYYLDEPEAGERRYRFKFHALIRDYRKQKKPNVPERIRDPPLASRLVIQEPFERPAVPELNQPSVFPGITNIPPFEVFPGLEDYNPSQDVTLNCVLNPPQDVTLTEINASQNDIPSINEFNQSPVGENVVDGYHQSQDDVNLTDEYFPSQDDAM